MAGIKRNREEETDDAASAADEREIEKLEKLERGEKPRVRVAESDSDPDDEELEVGADDDDEDEPETPERPNRQERRRQRGRDREAENNRQWEERLRAQENAAAEQRAMFTGLIERAFQQRPRQEQVDPETQQLDDKIKGLHKQRRALIERHAQLSRDGKLDQATHDRMQDEDFELQEKIAEARHQRYAPRQQQGMTPQQVQQISNQQRLRQDHGDVVSNPAAFAYFQGAYNELRGPKYRQPESWETIDKAMAKARQLAGLPPKGGRPAPTRGERSKFTGSSARGGGGGGQGRTTLVMTKELRELADAAYPHIPEKKRYQHYANVHGEKLAKRA